jgi:nicotinamidase-related amidase
MAKNRNQGLFGNVPDKSKVVLLVIDVINDLNFPEGKSLLRQALPMAKRLAHLKQVTKDHGYAVVYVNDNFGKWRSDFKSQVDHCLNDDTAGAEIVRLLRPDKDDYFVLKPAHSAFYSTTLDLLLTHFEAEILIITGMATNICVAFTANDAFLRGYELYIPGDCVAANTAKLTRDALMQMKSVLGAHIAKASALPWETWKKPRKAEPHKS